MIAAQSARGCRRPSARCVPPGSGVSRFRSDAGPSARLFFRGGRHTAGLPEPAMGPPGFSLLAREGLAPGRAPDGATRVVRIAAGALGAMIGAAPQPMRALRWSFDHVLAPTLDLFPRPFWLPVARTGQRRGAGAASRAPFGGLSRGGRGSFLAPFRPAPPPQSAIIPVSLCQFRVDELTPAPSELGLLPSPSILYAFGVSTDGQRWTARNFSRPPASPRIARLWTAWTASLLN